MMNLKTTFKSRGPVEVERIVEHRDTVLRIGLVHNDRLISDQAFSDVRAVSIGHDKRCDIVLDVDYAGPPVRFHNLCDDSVTLTADATSQIRMAHGNKAPANVDVLVSRHLAIREGPDIRVHVALNSRGRLVMGPYTILFQVIRRRVRVPVLPGQGIAKRLLSSVMGDPAWAACLAMSIFFIGALAAQAIAFQHKTGRYLTDSVPAEETSRQTMFIEVEQLEPEVQAPPPIAPTKPAATKEEPVKDTPKPKKPAKKRVVSKATPTIDPTDGPRNVRPAKPRGNLRKRTIAGAFGGATKIWQATDDGQGDVVAATAFGSGSGDAEREERLAIHRGDSSGELVKVTTGRRGFGERGRKITRLDNDRRPEKVVKPVKLVSTGALPNVKGKDRIAKILRRKNKAVRRCYEAALRDNPGLGGKVSVYFTIGTAGTITSLRVLGASGDFRSCIERKFRAIRGLPILTTPASFTQAYVFTRQ